MRKDGFDAIRQQVIPDKKKVARKNACRGRVNY